jgi:hypothetical protein
MAHGSMIYHVCKDCKQYILNNRFAFAPTCKCGKISEQINKSDLKELVKLPFMSELSTNHINWTKY